MASPTAGVCVRVAIAVLLLLAVFYLVRPLYWKLSATVHDIREHRQTVQQGISQMVLQAQKSVGWDGDESGSSVINNGNTTAAVRQIMRRC